MNTYAIAHSQRLLDSYANAMQSGTSGTILMELGVGQIAIIHEAAEVLGLNLAVIGPFSIAREQLWDRIKDADVILLDGALDQKALPGRVFAKSLMEGHFFENRFEKPVTVLVRTTRPEVFSDLPVLD
jgi:hypothetical protein